MITWIIFGIIVYIVAAALGFIPFVEALPFNLDVGLSDVAGYWYLFTHTVWFLTPVWDVFTWYFFIFMPMYMVVRLVFGARVNT